MPLCCGRGSCQIPSSVAPTCTRVEAPRRIATAANDECGASNENSPEGARTCARTTRSIRTRITRSSTERARPADRAPSPRKRVTGPTRSRAPPRTSSRAARATASWRCRRWRAAPCKMQVPVARQRCENCPHQFISNAAPDRGAGAGAGAWPQIFGDFCRIT